MTEKKELEYAVSYTTAELGQRILGKISIPDEGQVELNARDKVLEILYANGLRRDDIVWNFATYSKIPLHDGSVIQTHPLPSFEKFARAAVPVRV